MNETPEIKWGEVAGGLLILVSVSILGMVAFAPRESFEAWATFMNTVVRPSVGMVTGY